MIFYSERLSVKAVFTKSFLSELFVFWTVLFSDVTDNEYGFQIQWKHSKETLFLHVYSMFGSSYDS